MRWLAESSWIDRAKSTAIFGTTLVSTKSRKLPARQLTIRCCHFLHSPIFGLFNWTKLPCEPDLLTIREAAGEIRASVLVGLSYAKILAVRRMP